MSSLILDSPHRRRWLRTGFALGSIVVLPSARAHEYFTSTIRISHPWCRATPGSAPFAIVSMTFDEVTSADRLIGVETPVADGAQWFAGTPSPTIDVPIPAGRETVLGETGAHVRLVGLRHDLVLGRSYPLRLRFADGGDVQATLDVAYEALRG